MNKVNSGKQALFGFGLNHNLIVVCKLHIGGLVSSQIRETRIVKNFIKKSSTRRNGEQFTIVVLKSGFNVRGGSDFAVRVKTKPCEF
ncbi:hypothetical protein [Treponema phagedenis]|uniref:hypothetical protein n=1 Tax=Treponema phagedenis TaxID=162 RepID=UPI000465BED9|nr:hypothetical protein [Treponema phagedenis]NVP25410.1 hypothetical protein [Treponema phagedenis]QKS91119.1 hypothetical protein HPJ96_06150 [Treponema phagedenis]QLC57383.1 hypothetical protein HW453_00885 [Treponema phagedenis]